MCSSDLPGSSRHGLLATDEDSDPGNPLYPQNQLWWDRHSNRPVISHTPGADPKLFEPGTWYFDTRDRALVYLVRFPEQFVSALQGPPRLRLAVEPDYDDLDRNGRFDAGRDPVRGLKLVALEPYHWKVRGGEQK